MMNVTSEAVQAMEDAAKQTVGWDEVTNRKWNSKDKDQRIRSLFGAPSEKNYMCIACRRKIPVELLSLLL